MSADDLDEMIRAAEGVLGRTPVGTGGLVELGWEPIGDPTDSSWRNQFAALFQAQGRSLAATPALGISVAQYLTAGEVDLSVVAAGRARRIDDRIQVTVTRWSESAKVIVVIDGCVYEADAADLIPVGIADAIEPGAVSSGWLKQDQLTEVPGGPTRWVGAQLLARLAIAFETLGACEQMMAMAVQYASDRHQFGKPIGSFQAVQHILATAHVQLCALRDVSFTVLDVVMDENDHSVTEVALLKALAGRTGRAVGQATLQVLGAIGFTYEHAHHRYLRRTLTLDALYGSVDQLTFELGRAALREGIELSAVV